VVKPPVADLGDVGPATVAHPGTVHANTLRPGILLDRDGTITVDHGYVGSVDRVEFIEGAPEAMARFNRAGIPVSESWQSPEAVAPGERRVP
jgi:hypothetical protein